MPGTSRFWVSFKTLWLWHFFKHFANLLVYMCLLACVYVDVNTSRNYHNINKNHRLILLMGDKPKSCCQKHTLYIYLYYIVLRFGYLGKWSPCAYESLSTKGEDYYPHTLLYDSNFTLT
jgi:hypothetical protein